MADPLAQLRSMLGRPVSLDDALRPYLGADQWEAVRHADDAHTADGLPMSRLRGLVTLLALREAPPRQAMLVAALLWRSAPVAATVDELREAVVRICLWRGCTDLSEGDRCRHVVSELGSSLIVVTATDTDFFVGLQDERDVVAIIDRVPHAGGDDGRPDTDDGPEGPRPRLLQDA